MFPLMFGTLLMQATQLPCKIMEWMRLTFVHCAPRSTPPHVVVKVMTIIARCGLIHSCGHKLFVWHFTLTLDPQ